MLGEMRLHYHNNSGCMCVASAANKNRHRKRRFAASMRCQSLVWNAGAHCLSLCYQTRRAAADNNASAPAGKSSDGTGAERRVLFAHRGVCMCVCVHLWRKIGWFRWGGDVCACCNLWRGKIEWPPLPTRDRLTSNRVKVLALRTDTWVESLTLWSQMGAKTPAVWALQLSVWRSHDRRFIWGVPAASIKNAFTWISTIIYSHHITSIPQLLIKTP